MKSIIDIFWEMDRQAQKKEEDIMYDYDFEQAKKDWGYYSNDGVFHPPVNKQ